MTMAHLVFCVSSHPVKISSSLPIRRLFARTVTWLSRPFLLSSKSGAKRRISRIRLYWLVLLLYPAASAVIQWIRCPFGQFVRLVMLEGVFDYFIRLNPRWICPCGSKTALGFYSTMPRVQREVSPLTISILQSL